MLPQAVLLDLLACAASSLTDDAATRLPVLVHSTLTAQHALGTAADTVLSCQVQLADGKADVSSTGSLLASTSCSSVKVGQGTFPVSLQLGLALLDAGYAACCTELVAEKSASVRALGIA